MTVDWRGRPVRILSVHLIPALFGRILAEVGKGRLSYVREMAAAKTAQSEALLRAAGSSGTDAPVVICGDLNVQPQSHVLRRLTDRFTSAFDRAGAGFGYTLTAKAPALRVDHILTSGGIAVRRCWVPDVRVSDHRPVVAELAVP